jgi:hypothetical protein
MAGPAFWISAWNISISSIKILDHKWQQIYSHVSLSSLMLRDDAAWLFAVL